MNSFLISQTELTSLAKGLTAPVTNPHDFCIFLFDCTCVLYFSVPTRLRASGENHEHAAYSGRVGNAFE